MKTERLKAAVHELEELKREQEDDLKKTERLISELKQLAGIPDVEAVPVNSASLLSALGLGRKETYVEIALRLLRQAGRPLHVNEIVAEIEREKGLSKGSITRASVQTSLGRYMEKTGKIFKPQPAKFQLREKEQNKNAPQDVSRGANS